MKHPEQIAKIFSPQRIILAVMFGLIVSMYMIFRDFSMDKYYEIHWGLRGSLFFLLALVMVCIRALGYMYRLRILTEGAISWTHSFHTIVLWEFASALTPSVVGGSAAALYFVSKELKNTGKATAIVMVTALLDELFYIMLVPLMFIFISVDQLFVHGSFNFFGGSLLPTHTIFWIGYGFILSLTSIISFAVFLKPVYFKSLLKRIFQLPFLKRWQEGAIKTGDEIIITSQQMKGKPASYWLKAFGATVFSWTARFMVVNMLILAFTDAGHQVLIYARQLVMWVILLISPTPGGSGVAEYILPKFIGEFMQGFGDEIAFIWRLISYYLYLIVGAIILPIWLRRIYKLRP
jgi:uncharacterized protein (TIRG00374 family)